MYVSAVYIHPPPTAVIHPLDRSRLLRNYLEWIQLLTAEKWIWCRLVVPLPMRALVPSTCMRGIFLFQPSSTGVQIFARTRHMALW
jgi:hypothetical protein